MGEWQALIATCEQEIRSGRSREVAARLLPITRGSVPPEFLVVLAALCRRVGLIAHGLRFLSPAIVAHRNQQVAATGAQITEYAALLQRAGAQDEAVRWLGRPEVRDTPEALLILAFCRFAEWDYASAVPLLTQYLAQDLTPYARRVGEVNLVSALIAIGAASEADARLETLTQAARTERQWRLLVNCLEMRAQLDLAAGRFAVARAQLNAATELAATEQTLDQFLVAKWSAILDALELAKTEPLAHFRNEAAARGDWEGVREAVLYSLRAQMQDSLTGKVVYTASSSALCEDKSSLRTRIDLAIDGQYYLVRENCQPRAPEVILPQTLGADNNRPDALIWRGKTLTIDPDLSPAVGFFVLTDKTYAGNLGGISGANAACLAELTAQDWAGKVEAASEGHP